MLVGSSRAVGGGKCLAVHAVIQRVRPGVIRHELNMVAHAVIDLESQRLVVAGDAAEDVSLRAKRGCWTGPVNSGVVKVEPARPSGPPFSTR